MPENYAVNRAFYDGLWSESQLKRPERFNTWPLISGLLPFARERLEIGPGLRPRLPISGTCFVDISPPAIDQLSQHGGIAINAGITDLPFKDGKFDLVCALDVIEHVEDDRQVFSEVSRVLTEGGFFVFSVPLHARFWTEFDGLAGHVRRYDPADLSALLAAHDLVLESSAAYGMQPANHRLVDFGLWCLKNRRREAMWCYNRILMPLGMYFQKRLKFVPGLIDAPGVDEIVLLCRKQSAVPSENETATPATRPMTIVPRPARPLFSFYNLAQLGFFIFGIPRHCFGSVDVTNQCNLRCDHCYFFEQEHAVQWSLEQWRAHFERMKADGFHFYQCTWVGGEPLLRPEIIELGKRYFKYNTVTTNGSIALPDWKDVSWYISVDGGRRHHEQMRNTPGLFETIRQTIARSNGLKITIAYCITSRNYDDISASLEEWHRNPKVRNMVFSFITPIRGQDDSLWLEWKQKDRILDLLKAKKRIYGDFIVNTERALSLMKSDRTRSVTDRCPFAEKSFALGPAGVAKEPCMLGPKADCDRCGCVVPYYLRSLTDRRLVVRELFSKLTTKVGAFFHNS